METATLIVKLEAARRDLLDLTPRNRLINTSRSSTRSGRLEIVHELSEEVFRILVNDKKSMTFLPGKEEADEDEGEEATDDEVHLAQPDEDGNGLADHQTDTRLQTDLTSEALQRRLLKLYYDARTFEEEQGVNILYLALGFLKWYEDEKSDRERFAPLLLIPVQLQRRSAAARFRLEYTGSEITTNLSLQEKLKADFGIRLPDLPDAEDLSPNAYYASVRNAVADKGRWEVLSDDIVLWFFSFSKFLMYRDLKPDTWPGERQIANHTLIQRLLQDGFSSEPPICDDRDNIDRILQPLDLIHVMDADSSQTIAIEEAKRGRSLVIQGPPGTGKSQTIANLVATAVKEGKTVLFVAEKMAALEVVKRRLDNIGLGDICLELHSHKANKRSVLEELSRTLQLGRPKVDDIAGQAEQLTFFRDKLNRHAEIVHTHLEPAHVTPYQAIGELVRLRANGVQPVNFQLVDSLAWTPADRRERLNMLQDLAVHMREIGNPRRHPWRGVQLGSILPMDIDRISSQLGQLVSSLGCLCEASERLAELLDQEPVGTFFDSSNIAQFAQRLLKAPVMDRRALADPVWAERRQAIDSLVAMGKTLDACRESLEPRVADVAWSTDVSAARRALAAHGRSWFRFFNRDYHQAQATLRGILTADPPKPLEERLQILDQLMEGQKARQEVNNVVNQKLGQEAFGTQWHGERTEWKAAEQITRWEQECRDAKVPGNFRQVIAQADLETAGKLYREVARTLKPLLEAVRQVFAQLKLDLNGSFDQPDARNLSLRELHERLKEWQSAPEALSKWIAYYTRWRRLDAQGMGPLAERLDQGQVAAEQAMSAFEMAYFEGLMRKAFEQYPELSAFDGVSHEQLLTKFKQLDLERLAMARQEVARAHHNRLPKYVGDAGELGELRREMKKQRRHKPLRKLLQDAGHAVQALKPVFMMSPISIAQYLEPGVLEFDLLLIDEASQVRPVDALGAIARARQIVVVGDDRQLPPTQFFSRLAGDDGDDDAQGFQAGDLESILGLCEAQGVPQRMLQWHYRSRHHSLIAVSNREFYDENLFVVPSPFGDGEGLGLCYHHVRDGVFDRGGSATNRVEARAVADAVMRHARKHPELTLGVGAFSVAQRDAILEELEMRRRATPELEAFFASGAAEPFFAKNLENIQGDERDVIFISVGYGKDGSGYMAMSFGPLNNDGGERRLNVLITRARQRCEVFSSITADDIDLNRSQKRGVQALKSFLAYAQTGVLGVAKCTDRGHDSPFEYEAARAIIGCGYEVHAQVGVAGFFVDLAVVDPQRPGRYLLGIECDGAAYHCSRSARDRDRLRQQVLEDRGWIVHRIWSTDWFHRPDDQLRKVIAALEDAKIAWAARCDSQPVSRDTPTHPDILARDDDCGDTQAASVPIEAVPYVEAQFDVDTTLDIHQLSIQGLAKIAARVVDIEGPVHQDEVARRIASLWGLQRVGRRISGAVETALAEAERSGGITQHGLFFQSKDRLVVPIRNRESVQSANLRKPDYLPPTEIRAAVLAVVRAHVGINVDDTAREVGRLLGFRSTSSQLRQVVEDEIKLLIDDGPLGLRNEKLYGQEAISHPA